MPINFHQPVASGDSKSEPFHLSESLRREFKFIDQSVSVSVAGVLLARLSGSIGRFDWEERQSSNYLGEQYFRCFALGIELTVAITDDDEFKDFGFWLSFQPEAECGAEYPFIDGLADCVARKLAQTGYEVIRPLDMGRVGSGGILYRRNPDPDSGPKDRILTEEFSLR